MKTKYTKKQITEAIAYWKNKLNEASTNQYVLKVNGKTYNLVDPETDDLYIDTIETPYVQIYVNDDDTVECVVFKDDTPETYAFTVAGLSGSHVRAKNLHRDHLEVIKI